MYVYRVRSASHDIRMAISVVCLQFNYSLMLSLIRLPKHLRVAPVVYYLHIMSGVLG